jgi:hypothetical protein
VKRCKKKAKKMLVPPEEMEVYKSAYEMLHQHEALEEKEQNADMDEVRIL